LQIAQAAEHNFEHDAQVVVPANNIRANIGETSSASGASAEIIPSTSFVTLAAQNLSTASVVSADLIGNLL
jgi:hypothetical protein